jgi:TrmH RNA methyltransferase
LPASKKSPPKNFPTKPRIQKTAGEKRKTESKFYGIHACQAIFSQRRDDIIRAYFTERTKVEFRELASWCAKQRLAYHLVDDDELAAITASVHHEGVCLIAKKRKNIDQQEMLQRLKAAEKPSLIFYLDGVGNPHNLGAILRSAANFGVQFIVGKIGELPELSPSAARIAEGGAEFVELIGVENPEHLFKSLTASGFEMIATDSHGGSELWSTALPKRAVIIMGAEILGVSKKILALAKKRIQIPGTGKIESLNVSVAAGILAAEFHRQHHSKLF